MTRGRRKIEKRRYQFDDKGFKAVINRCDICNDPIPCKQDIEIKIGILKEIDDSYERECDRQDYITGPRLLLCGYCQKEYQIPGYRIN